MTDVGQQLRAAYGALVAAQVAVETALAALETEAPAPDQPAGHPEVQCDHPNAQNASAMGGRPRRYCADCRNFVAPDGTTLPAEDL